MDGDGKRVTGRRRCCDRSARAVSACLDGAKRAVVVVAGWCLGRRMAEWELKIGQKWISNCWCPCLLPACHSKHCTALLAKSSRLLSPCESVHLCELPAPCPVPLPPGRPGHARVRTVRVMEHAFIQGRATPVIGSALRGLAKAPLLDIAQGHASPSRLFHTAARRAVKDQSRQFPALSSVSTSKSRIVAQSGRRVSFPSWRSDSAFASWRGHDCGGCE